MILSNMFFRQSVMPAKNHESNMLICNGETLQLEVEADCSELHPAITDFLGLYFDITVLL